jgi:hypothetical protein
VHLDHGDAGRLHGVADRVGGVGQRAGVEDGGGHAAAAGVQQRLHQLALPVGLEALDPQAELAGELDPLGLPAGEDRRRVAELQVAEAEFVEDGETGLVASPDPKAIADAFDRLFAQPDLARRLGEAGRRRVEETVPEWPEVVERLLA